MIGRLVLRALVGGRAAWQCEVQQGVQVASLCVGQTPEQAVKILSRVFALCRAAHSVAARQAFGLPCVQGGQQEQILEILRDHAIAFYVHFPKFFGLQQDRLLVQRINTGQVNRQVILGADISLADINPTDLAFWLKETRGENAPLLPRFLACLRQKIRPTWGQVEVPALGMESLTTFEQNTASLSGYDASLLPDYVHTPLLQGVMAQDGGISLFVRVLARVLDMLACIEGCVMARPAAWLSEEILPQGWGLTRAARGVLWHKAHVHAGVVKDYTVISPTQWHLETRGMMERIVASLPSGEEGRLAVQVLLCALNPCVPVTIMS